MFCYLECKPRKRCYEGNSGEIEEYYKRVEHDARDIFFKQKPLRKMTNKLVELIKS
jgi:hypothetical protein